MNARVVATLLAGVCAFAHASPGPQPLPAPAPLPVARDQPYPGTIKLAVDATDLDRPGV